MERIGMALARPKGDTQRQDEYGIYVVLEAYGVTIDNPTLYIKYEGYREQRKDGEAMVGLPLAGQNADHLQPFVRFYPNSQDRIFGPESHTVPTWSTVRFFRDGPWNS